MPREYYIYVIVPGTLLWNGNVPLLGWLRSTCCFWSADVQAVVVYGVIQKLVDYGQGSCNCNSVPHPGPWLGRLPYFHAPPFSLNSSQSVHRINLKFHTTMKGLVGARSSANLRPCGVIVALRCRSTCQARTCAFCCVVSSLPGICLHVAVLRSEPQQQRMQNMTSRNCFLSLNCCK